MEEKAAQNSKNERLLNIAFSVFSALLFLHILTLGIRHGASSPFNTLPGKLSFIGIFVGAPAYVYWRISKPIGTVFLALSLFLWTLGFSILLSFITTLSEL